MSFISESKSFNHFTHFQLKIHKKAHPIVENIYPQGRMEIYYKLNINNLDKAKKNFINLLSE